ncbi:MAG TPA: TIM barrel protein [Streptosporangiaceae bacterium]
MDTHRLRFDVNCSILFTELPLLARPAAAAAAGFDAVEFWWPFGDDPVPGDREVDGFITALADAGVSLAGLNFAGGNLAEGHRGWLSQPARSAAFLENIDACVGIAQRTGCQVLNALYGNRVDGVTEAEQDELALENLALAAQGAGRAGATVVVEALNVYESPRYPLLSAAAAVEAVDKVRAHAGVSNIAFLADLYHLGRMGEDLPGVLTTYAGMIGHVQIADVPGRGAPGTGETDFGRLFADLARLGYPGRVGLEYKPSDPADSAASFGWLT